ncbi:Hypothetical protein PHPALM_37398 [Phytophthora palmivora]|uniref:Uncharacterized protein n=1 Tax=Phytophthora palmivora TaxID=4796 RepID=A0A2P4WXJ3_9STRA|nr:Hypothetical protein PHPALM_37398 [Phytophthora palmivora]
MLPEEVDEGFDHPFYAQVLRINNDIVTFRSLEGGEGYQFVASTYQASPVPPIVALLLQHVESNLSDWSHGDLEELQVTIMN